MRQSSNTVVILLALALGLLAAALPLALFSAARADLMETLSAVVTVQSAQPQLTAEAAARLETVEGLRAALQSQTQAAHAERQRIAGLADQLVRATRWLVAVLGALAAVVVTAFVFAYRQRRAAGT